MSEAPVIRLAGLTKAYNVGTPVETEVLHGLDLSLEQGEFAALIGPSGSGKTTLLTILGCLARPTEGRVRLKGEDISGLPERFLTEIRRSTFGFIFQQFNLVGRLTLFSNVALGSLGRIPFLRGVFGFWPAETKQAAMAALARVGVAEYAAQRANTLAGGQQQRGAIARALVQKAKIILADEPVASLDPVSARRVMEILRDLNQQDGLTVVVTLHQVDYALRYCERVVALKAGKIVYDGPAAGLDRKQLIDIYGPEFEDVFWEGAPK